MKYLMLIYIDENAMNDAERQKCYLESTAYANQLHASKLAIAGSRTHFCSYLDPSHA